MIDVAHDDPAGTQANPAGPSLPPDHASALSGSSLIAVTE